MSQPQTRRCPICGKPVAAAFQPFCSRRCSDVDLHRWLGGVYRVPSAGADERESGEEPVERRRPNDDQVS